MGDKDLGKGDVRGCARASVWMDGRTYGENSAATIIVGHDGEEHVLAGSRMQKALVR